MERTIEEKLQGISFLESLGLDNETIDVIEDAIDNPDDYEVITSWEQLGL